MNIKSSYDTWSNSYDHDENATRDLDKHATRSTFRDKYYNSILEIGCGTGKNTEFFITIADKVLSVDFSERMLEQAKGKIKSQKVDFILHDIQNTWNFTDKKVQLITFNLVLEHIIDLNHIFKESYKLLSDNGTIFINELHPDKRALGKGNPRFNFKNKIHIVESYAHTKSKLIMNAQNNNFKLVDSHDWFKECNQEIPQIMSLMFEKNRYNS